MVKLLTRKDTDVGVGEYDSVAWALEVHAKVPDMGKFLSAVLHGHHEDSPDKIEFYTQAEPLVTDQPAFVWEPEDE